MRLQHLRGRCGGEWPLASTRSGLAPAKIPRHSCKRKKALGYQGCEAQSRHVAWHRPCGPRAGLDALTTLTRVQPHRLRALILEDLERFPNSAKGDILRRVGPEIPNRTFCRALEELVASGEVVATREKRWRRYRLKGSIGHAEIDGR